MSQETRNNELQKIRLKDLASKLPAEKLESVVRYMRILVRMKDVHSEKAEILNNSLQSKLETGDLMLYEADEIMSEIEAALDMAS